MFKGGWVSWVGLGGYPSSFRHDAAGVMQLGRAEGKDVSPYVIRECLCTTADGVYT